jgi:hypothetical protein
MQLLMLHISNNVLLNAFVVVANVCIKKRRRKKGKAIPVTGRRGPYSSKTMRLPRSVDNRITHGGGCQSYTPAAFTPRKIPGTHLC